MGGRAAGAGRCVQGAEGGPARALNDKRRVASGGEGARRAARAGADLAEDGLDKVGRLGALERLGGAGEGVGDRRAEHVLAGGEAADRDEVVGDGGHLRGRAVRVGGPQGAARAQVGGGDARRREGLGEGGGAPRAFPASLEKASTMRESRRTVPARSQSCACAERAAARQGCAFPPFPEVGVGAASERRAQGGRAGSSQTRFKPRTSFVGSTASASAALLPDLARVGIELLLPIVLGRWAWMSITTRSAETSCAALSDAPPRARTTSFPHSRPAARICMPTPKWAAQHATAAEFFGSCGTRRLIVSHLSRRVRQRVEQGRRGSRRRRRGQEGIEDRGRIFQLRGVELRGGSRRSGIPVRLRAWHQIGGCETRHNVFLLQAGERTARRE